MHPKYPNLFSPVKIRGFTFKNRLISSPVGPWTFAPDNLMFDYAIDFFEERARGGCAAVTMGDTEVNAGEPDADDFGVYFNLRERKGTAALNEFANAVKQHGAHVSVQLNHAGAHFGPSPNLNHAGVLSKEMSPEQIKTAVGQFAACARRLRDCGFDMCMLHGAHGWLLDQFLSPRTNRRSDGYGGCLTNRMRFIIEVVDAVRAAVGKDFMIEYRISGCDPVSSRADFEDKIALINALEGKIDIVHVSAGSPGGGDGVTFPTYLDPLGVNVRLAEAVKKRVSTPVAAVGSILTPAQAEEILASGKADFVAMGRQLLADPELPNKARRGLEGDIRPCIGCHACLDEMHRSHLLNCTVNPRLGREHRLPEFMCIPAQTPKRVAVIGGGPAGMQAAITARDRGHRVVLFEKSEALGGILRHTDHDPLKYRLKSYKDYLVGQVAKRDIDLRLGTEATPEAVAALEADAVIAALGSAPIVPPIPGSGGPKVLAGPDAFNPGTEPGQRVCVIGGNMVGCEIAVSLKDAGREVTLLEMAESLHPGANMPVAEAIDRRLAGVRCLTGARCTRITGEGVTAETAHGTLFIPADSVVLAVGMRPRAAAAEKFRYCAPDFYPVGDCVKPATVRQAVAAAYFAALDI